MKFTPIYLFENTERTETFLKAADENAKLLNEFIASVSQQLKHEPTPTEKHELKTNAKEWIEAKVLELTPLKNANFDIQLTSIGADGIPELLKVYKSKQSTFNHYEMELVNNAFVVSENQKQMFKQQNENHTTTQKQNDAFEIAKELEATFAKAEKAGFINVHNAKLLSKVTNLLHRHYKENTEPKEVAFVVNYKGILSN